MKNLQHNNPTIGAQSFNLADKAGEDVYIYGEVKPLIYNLTRVRLRAHSNYGTSSTGFRYYNNYIYDYDLRIKQGDNLSVIIDTLAGGPVSPTMPIDLYQPFYLGFEEDNQTFIPFVRFYNFNENDFILGNQPGIEFEVFYPKGVQIYWASNGRVSYTAFTSDFKLDISESFISRNTNEEFSIELEFYKQG